MGHDRECGIDPAVPAGSLHLADRAGWAMAGTADPRRTRGDFVHHDLCFDCQSAASGPVRPLDTIRHRLVPRRGLDALDHLRGVYRLLDTADEGQFRCRSRGAVRRAGLDVAVGEQAARFPGYAHLGAVPRDPAADLRRFRPDPLDSASLDAGSARACADSDELLPAGPHLQGKAHGCSPRGTFRKISQRRALCCAAIDAFQSAVRQVSRSSLWRFESLGSLRFEFFAIGDVNSAATPLRLSLILGEYEGGGDGHAIQCGASHH